MIQKKKIWVLVADGARARIFRKDHQKLENALGQDFVAENLKESDLGTSKPGRAFESGYSGHHAYAPHTDWHQHQKDRFAKELCDILEAATQKKEFDELIMISPPETLGNLRGHLSKTVLSKITAEIPKDVTKLSELDLMSFLEKEIEA